ncbi:NAD(P)-dependent dehydrogenase (short-subunit alcohol dehydrogenase family) [Rahnella sp. BIGb0236]|uniref:SDR family NAD(P)-dependent oxidoreductase n=1 Tax=Rahnella TaxID=34037 RepID=UPI000BB1882F|nr:MULTISPECIES: SDR family oxidoreductase [Rahnella]PBI78821.1 oxidoreductase [Rahnella victoriana]TDS90195.1 NAD(P)-dependent dehydrogenase (short-subunit alcohol dehydrogenase family) [Rahnella sp. BIGb0236]
MSNSLTGKRVLVTGASRGIGKAIAESFADAGADVAITFQNSREKAQEVVREIEAKGQRAVAIAADSADPEAVQNSVIQAATFLGGLDILVNNAGVIIHGPFEEVKLDELNHILNVNIRSVVLATQSALAIMKDGGRIINIGSCQAERVPGPGLSIYSMTKSALTSLTRGLARDLGPRGITVNLVNPGPTDTDMNPADGENSENQRLLTALGHFGATEDVANAVIFLAGPGAKHITGVGLAVDGGINA